MNRYVVKNRIQPVIVGLCEVVVTAAFFPVIIAETLNGVTEYTVRGFIAVIGMFLAAVLHCSSIAFFKIEIGPGLLTIRSWQTLFRTKTVAIAELDTVRFVSGGPAHTPLLVLSRGKKKLAKVSAFCTNTDRLEMVLRGYGKWKERK